MKRLIIVGFILCLLLISSVQAATYLSSYNSYKKLSLHMNTTGGLTIDDAVPSHTGTLVGKADANTTVGGYLGDAQGWFSGTGGYISYADSADWVLSGDWTISLFINESGTASAYFSQYKDVSNRMLAFTQSGSGQPILYMIGGNSWTVQAPAASAGVRHHVVFVRSGTTITGYTDGVAGTPTTSTSDGNDFAAPFFVGAYNEPNGWMNGRMDELTLWKGVAIPIAELYPQNYEVGQTIVIPSFTPVTSSGVSPLPVSFTGSATGTPTAWNWTIKGYGFNTSTYTSASTSQNPSFTFLRGNFSIKLNVSYLGGFNESSQNSWVNVSSDTTLGADFVGAPTSGYEGFTVNFVDMSTGDGLYYWEWDFGDTGTSLLRNPSHIYSTQGVYDVKLTVKGYDGTNVKTRTGYISVFKAYQTYPYSEYSDPLGYILSNGVDNKINFYNFKNATDGKAIEVIISGSYEVA